MGRDIFITGTSGFIGSNLVRRLGADNRVYALLRTPVENIDDKVTIVEGDILEPGSFSAAVEKCEIVYHCAACISFKKKDFDEAYKINVEGTRNVLEAAYKGRVKKVVHLSACAVLGFSSDKNKAFDESVNPEIEKDNVYAHTKKLAEEEVQKYVQRGLDVSIANIATVYGQGDSKLNSGTIIKAVYEGTMRLVPPGGTSFVSVDDLVEGLILLADKGRPGERYIFCAENMEYLVLAQRIAKTLKVKEPRYKLPAISYYPALWIMKGMESVARSNSSLMTAQILKETYGYKYFNSEKARVKLGWKPSQSLETAVEKAFDYYRDNNLI